MSQQVSFVIVLTVAIALRINAQVTIADPAIVAKEGAPRISTPYENNGLYIGAEDRTRQKLNNVRAMIKKKGCRTSICFAIDGSNSITGEAFTLQKSFVHLLTKLITTRDKPYFCAVQYAETTTPISPITNRTGLFLGKLRTASKAGGGTNLAAGIGYGVVQLFPLTENENNIIVLGDGLANIGPQIPMVTKEFLERRGALFAVGVGRTTMYALTAISGDRKRAFQISKTSELINAAISVAEQVCNVGVSTD